MIIQEPFLRVLRPSDKHYRPRSFEVAVQPMVFEFKGALIEVPVGTLTDFASIPKFLRDRFSVNGDHRLASIAHDYLYSKLGMVETYTGSIIEYARSEADKLFYILMRSEGVGKTEACLMYRAVNIFGWTHASGWQV